MLFRLLELELLELELLELELLELEELELEELELLELLELELELLDDDLLEEELLNEELLELELLEDEAEEPTPPDDMTGATGLSPQPMSEPPARSMAPPDRISRNSRRPVDVSRSGTSGLVLFSSPVMIGASVPRNSRTPQRPPAPIRL